MAFENPPFSVRRGDDRLVEIYVENPDGVTADLSSATIRLTYGRSGAAAQVTKTEADLTVAGGKVTYRFHPEDTMALEAYRTYWIQCRISFPDGAGRFVDTVATGSFSVEQTQG